MIDPGAIRAGASYVEISADDSPMVRRLAESRARLARWAAEAAAEGRVAMTRATEGVVLAGEGGRRGFLSGGFKGVELFSTGMRLATAIGAAKAVMKDVQMYSALFRGDMEGARKAAEDLPLGLGGIVKELSGPVDSWAKSLVYRLKGVSDKVYGPSNRKAMMAEVAAHNQKAAAVQKASDAVADSAKRGRELIAAAMDEHTRLTMSERDFIGYEVRMLNLAADQAESLLGWRLAILDATEKQKAAEEEWAAVKAGADEDNRRFWAQLDAETEEYVRKAEEAGRLVGSLRTPAEVAASDIAEARAMHEEGLITDETYRRAVRRAVEQAAAALPETARATTTVAGTFSGFAFGGLGAGGTADRVARATEDTARNTERLLAVARDLGVTYE